MYLLFTIGIGQLSPLATLASPSVKENDAGIRTISDTESHFRNLCTGAVADYTTTRLTLDDGIVELLLQHEAVGLGTFIEDLEGSDEKAS